MVASQTSLLEVLENYVSRPLYDDVYIDLVSTGLPVNEASQSASISLSFFANLITY